MDNFMFYSPTCFVFGKDAENQAGALVRRFGGTRVLIHYGGGSAVRSGLIDRVQASLNVSCWAASNPIRAAVWSMKGSICAGRKKSILSSP